jgi:hypothetical protein
METREILLKADKVTLTFERTAESKIRVTTTSWDDAKLILPNQAGPRELTDKFSCNGLAKSVTK